MGNNNIEIDSAGGGFKKNPPHKCDDTSRKNTNTQGVAYQLIHAILGSVSFFHT